MFIISLLLFAAAIFRWLMGVLILCGKLENIVKDNQHKVLTGAVSLATGFVFAVDGLILAVSDEPPLPLVVFCVLVGGIAAGVANFRMEEENR